CGNEMLVAIFSSADQPEEAEGASELGIRVFLKKHPDFASLSAIVEHLGGTPPAESALKLDLAG
ncbi:MAG: hypothetical protein ACREF9_15600, partial [Opitutaceae bacterium]